ncbi:MAG: gene transfer agent family protein [Alphaproteobacteria bacterium]|nr:gene transfer agent family protein [Alphaproteobacteria bacterium]
MANGARGETRIEIAGRSYRLCLTLGALAEIETAFGAGSLGALDERLGNPGARDVIAILAALLRGGGEAVSDEDVAAMPLSMREAASAIAAAFAAAGLGRGAGEPPGNASAPGQTMGPARSRGANG